MMQDFKSFFGEQEPKTEKQIRQERFCKSMNTMINGFTKGIPDFENGNVRDIWGWAFREYDNDIFTEACKQAVLTLDWFPSIAELRRLADLEVIGNQKSLPI